jgi:hypothetical protein
MAESGVLQVAAVQKVVRCSESIIIPASECKVSFIMLLK